MPSPGAEHVADDEADRQRERADHLEVDQRLDGNTSEFGQVTDLVQAQHDRAEDDRTDQYLQQGDEGVPQGLRLLPVSGQIRPDDDRQSDGDQYLHVQGTQKRPLSLVMVALRWISLRLCSAGPSA